MVVEGHHDVFDGPGLNEGGRAVLGHGQTIPEVRDGPGLGHVVSQGEADDGVDQLEQTIPPIRINVRNLTIQRVSPVRIDLRRVPPFRRLNLDTEPQAE